MVIREVHPESPLFGYVRPGYSLVSVNGRAVQDVIDFRYQAAEERVHMVFADQQGSHHDFRFEELYGDDLGLTFDDEHVRTCKNDCVFCFVHQQPRGMRKPLHVMDDDYRLSFTHGNFITLSNVSDGELDRIIEQRLSPLYISVHATDDKLRRCIMRNQKLGPIVPALRYLIENGISIHTQAVLCPGINDGEYLERTINELAALAPGVETMAAVPVGLTKYRNWLTKLRTYTQSEAAALIDYVENRQRDLFDSLGTRFVWPADEFYVLAGRDVPKLHEYEEMLQFENGVGMIREFITLFNRRRAHLKQLHSKKRVLMFTGESAYPYLDHDILPYVREQLDLDVTIQPVRNQFWGDTVTVSGLLTGQDLLRQGMARRDDYDLFVLPPNCLNNDDLFLDDFSLDEFRRRLDKPVLVGSYNFAQTLRAAFS